MTYALDANVRDLAATFGRDVGWLDENTRKITTDATRAPLPTDDEVQGYAPGSRWLWEGQEWVAAGVAEGAAVWAPFSYGTLPSRAEAEAANVPPQIDRIGVLAPNGDTLFYKRDAAGTALTTGDGAKWSPADEVTFRHFGALGDGVTDDTAACQAAMDYIAGLPGNVLRKLSPGSGIFRVTAPLRSTQDFLFIQGEGKGTAHGSTTSPYGGTTILYDGAALAETEGVFMFGDELGAANQNTARGIQLESMSILCQGLANGVYGYLFARGRLSNLYIDGPRVGVVLRHGSFSNNIDGVTVYDPTLGGLDLRLSCHSNTISNCNFYGTSDSVRSPEFGIRVGEEGNCSAVAIIGNNFDFFRVTQGHILTKSKNLGMSIIGNYIECRGDGVTAKAIVLQGGVGIALHGNRISKTDNPTVTVIDYGVEIWATVSGISVAGNYFSGFDTAAIKVSSGTKGVTISSNDTNGGRLYDDFSPIADGPQSVVADNGGVAAGFFRLGDPARLVVSGGAITLGSNSFIRVDTEAEAAADDLDTINGGAGGRLLVIQLYNNARVVTLKNSVGNLSMSADFAFATGRDKIMFIYNPSTSRWDEISRSVN